MMIFVKIRRLILLIFVFILCYADYNPFGEDSALTLTNVIGSLYLLSVLMTFKTKINYKEIKPFIIPLLLLFILVTIMSIVNKSEYNILRSEFNFGWLRGIILFVFIFYDLKGYPKFQRKIINVYLISIVSVAILATLNIGVTNHWSGRLLIFGTNANVVGFWGVLGITFILNHVIFGDISNKNKLFILLLLPFLLFLIAKSGSRGAFILLMVSLISFLIYSGETLRSKIQIISLMFIFWLFAIIILLQNDILAERLLSFVKTGDTSGRDELGSYAIRIFKENPIFGCGETGYEIKITTLLGKFMGPHNVYLYILVTGGISGLLLFLSFLYRIYKSAIENYRLNKNVLPIILFFIICLSMLKGGGVLTDRVTWFLLAYIAASTTLNIDIKKKDKENENISC